MSIFEIQGPDGKTYEVDAPDMEQAVAAVSGVAPPQETGRKAPPAPSSDPAYADALFAEFEGKGQPDPELDAKFQRADVSSLPMAAANSFANGVTFGGVDELAAAAAALGGGDYDKTLADARKRLEIGREAAPVTSALSEIAGGVIPAGLAGKALGIGMGGKSLLDTSLQGAKIGAAEGGLYGFLNGEGGAGNRAADAASGTALGGLVGGAAPSVIALGARGGRAVGDLLGGGVDALTNRANSGRANRAIMDVLRKSGIPADDVQAAVARAAQEGQPEFRLMDATGKAGQRKASGIVRSGGEGSESLANFLEQRQLDQPNRVSGFVEDAFGYKGSNKAAGTDVVPYGHGFKDTPADVLRGKQVSAAQTKDALTKARSAVADAAYGAARKGAGPVDVRGALSVIDDRIGGMRGGNISGDSIDGRLSTFRKRLAANPAPKGEISRELSDFDRVLGVKQDVDDAIGAAVRAGRNNEARELGKLKSALDQALESSSDMYRKANDEFAKASRVIGAVDEGVGMARPGARSADTIQSFKGMTPDQQAAARVGYGDRTLARIEANSSPTSNVAKALNSTKARDEVGAMALDPALMNARRLRENTMWETQNRALGGSRTADNLQDVADTGMIADVGRIVRDAATGRIGTALGTVANRVGSVASGQNEATRTLIARMLMSDNPQKALAQALRQEAGSQAKKRVIEAITRAMGRQFIPSL